MNYVKRKSNFNRLLSFSLLFAAILSGCGAEKETVGNLQPSVSSDNSENDGNSPSGLAYRMYGVNFSPFIDGQDPNLGSQISEEQLRARLEVIEPYTEWIRTFGSTSGLEEAGRIAHSVGLKVACGAWLSRDLSANEREISNLISAAKAASKALPPWRKVCCAARDVSRCPDVTTPFMGVDVNGNAGQAKTWSRFSVLNTHTKAPYCVNLHCPRRRESGNANI